jgi:hypothetical protein
MRLHSTPFVCFLRPLLLSGVIAGLAVAPSARATAYAGVVEPTAPIVLSDGTSLAMFDTWLEGHKHSDPDRVFTIVDQVDGAPAIRISGQHWGGLITKAEYRNYYLIAEFRWGVPTWGRRKDKARDSGILLHCDGEPGNQRPDFSSPWMRSIEYQIIEGGTGDIIVVPGVNTVGGPRIFPSVRVRTVENPPQTWSPSGTPTVYRQGRVNWRHRDPNFKDELGFRGPRDVEREVGEWNRIEILCAGNSLTYFLNGVLVNYADECSLSQGKLLFQSEGSELFFRQIEIQPLKSSRAQELKRLSEAVLR